MTLPGQTAHRNQELARAPSAAAGAGPGTVTRLTARAREMVADEDHASARSETARLRPRRAARLWDVSGVVQPDVAGERLLTPDRDALGAREDAEGARDVVITLGEKLLLAATLSQWNRIEALATQVRAVARLASAHYESSGAAGLNLTGAELRLLPLLATHLSLPQIGAELFLSPHTVKSQAISIYRKLGASSRREAVACARKSRLLET
jgi:ATP/maltotriose-dependent transcriptional regulator MalT